MCIVLFCRRGFRARFGFSDMTFEGDSWVMLEARRSQSASYIAPQPPPLFATHSFLTSSHMEAQIRDALRRMDPRRRPDSGARGSTSPSSGGDKQPFEMKPEEVDALEKNLANPEFIKHFQEYLADISDPKHLEVKKFPHAAPISAAPIPRPTCN